MKRIILLILFAFGSHAQFAQSISVDALRREYYKVNADSAACAKLYNKISKAANSDNTSLAYKGAITAAMANHAKEKQEKLKLFNSGKKLLEQSIVSDSSNIELRFLRFTIQTNCPKALGYNKQIGADKKFILANFSAVTNTAIRNMMLAFVAQSTYLTDAEKQKLKQ
ncbi:MAG TPA: hypothetical protein VGC65_06125 [Bacteroidia bacterium]|jgi:hypothetical protein